MRFAKVACMLVALGALFSASTAGQTPGFISKTTLPDTSPKSPALASLRGILFVAWKGDGNDSLNVEYSVDNGRTFGHAYTSGETSPQAPALCAHNGQLFIAWKGNGNDNLNVARVVFSAGRITGFANKVSLPDTSASSPALSSLNGRLFIAWRGDGNDTLNVEYSADDGRTFGHKFTSGNEPGGSGVVCARRRTLHCVEGRRKRQPQRCQSSHVSSHSAGNLERTTGMKRGP